MRYLVAVIILFLGACATPYEACRRDATQDLRILEHLIEETRANIQRGFTYEQTQRTVFSYHMCTSADAGTRFCWSPRTVYSQEPVAIDLNAERAKLQSLEVRYAEKRREAVFALQQCEALNP